MIALTEGVEKSNIFSTGRFEKHVFYVLLMFFNVFFLFFFIVVFVLLLKHKHTKLQI